MEAAWAAASSELLRSLSHERLGESIDRGRLSRLIRRRVACVSDDGRASWTGMSFLSLGYCASQAHVCLCCLLLCRRSRPHRTLVGHSSCRFVPAPGDFRTRPSLGWASLGRLTDVGDRVAAATSLAPSSDGAREHERAHARTLSAHLAVVASCAARDSKPRLRGRESARHACMRTNRCEGGIRIQWSPYLMLTRESAPLGSSERARAGLGQ